MTRLLHRRFGGLLTGAVLLIGYGSLATGLVTSLHHEEAGSEHDAHSCTICHQIASAFSTLISPPANLLLNHADGPWEVAYVWADPVSQNEHQPISLRGPPQA